MIINKWEKQFNIEFDPKALKIYIDEWCAQGIENGEGNWEQRKDTELLKVWTRSDGSEFNHNIPAIRCEHHFPDIDDPEVIKRALIDFRTEWDDQMDISKVLDEYGNQNT